VSVDQILHLTSEDDLASMRERLSRVQTRTVILVVPNEAEVLQNPVNLRLLRRYAEQMDLSVQIVTRDRTTEEWARRLGFSVYHSLESIPRKRRGGLTKEQIKQAPRLPPVRWYRWLASFWFKLIALAFLVAGAAAVALTGVLFVPSATIHLSPASKTMTISMNLTASPQIRVLDSAKGQFPAKPIQVLIEDTGQVETTASKQAPDQPATGTVVFANRGAGELRIAKGTVVRTGSGVSTRFQTEEDATLPAGASSTVRVKIKAIDPGSNGNVKAGSINIIESGLSFQVNVINDEDLKGGTEKLVRYVTLQDRNNLRDLIVQKIRANSYTELRKSIQPDDVVPVETLTVSVNESSFDKPLDAEGAYLTGKVRATVAGLLLSGDDLKKLMAARLNDQVDPGFQLLPENISYGMPINVHYTDGVVTLQLTATARIQAQINLRDVQRLAAGKTEATAAAEITQRFVLAKPPQIETNQDMLGRLPLFLSRITVTSDTSN
jgi:hypothetical protein